MSPFAIEMYPQFFHSSRQKSKSKEIQEENLTFLCSKQEYIRVVCALIFVIVAKGGSQEVYREETR